VPTGRAEKELLAPPADVWAFLAEPHHFADWWPGIAAVEPDRRGVSAGARWRVRASEPGWFRKDDAGDTLVVVAADPEQRFSFELVGRKLRAELLLDPARDRHTTATLTVRQPWPASPKGLARDAVSRLHDLCQTAAGL
jgi:uncharacterized protein YndB with AHSA1/START domain